MNEPNPHLESQPESADSSNSTLLDYSKDWPSSAVARDGLPATEPADDGPEPPSLKYIFFGADGLRAGWGLVLFIAILFGSFYVIHLARTVVDRPSAKSIATQQTQSNRGTPTADSATEEKNKEMSPREGISHEGIALLAAIFATFVMSRVEKRPFGVFGLGGRDCLKQFLAGLFWGVVCLSLLVGLLRWGGFLHFDTRLLNGEAAFRYGAIWAVGFLIVALLEETMTRGYAQYTLARGMAAIYGVIFKNTRHRHALGFWTAALFFSFVFGLGHTSNPGESPIGLLAAGLAGLVFCFSLYRTGSLWWAIGIHTSWDWAQSFLYGVPDSGLMAQGHLFATHPSGKPILSGGLTGPEGSIFSVLVLLLIVGIIFVTLRQTHVPGEGLSHPDGTVPASSDL